MDIADVEQQSIVDEYDKLWEEFNKVCKGNKWNRFRGSAYSILIAKKLEQHLPKHVRCVMSSWVEGCPNEFDILIVDKNAVPQGYRLSYAANTVYLAIEVKGAAVYYKKQDIEGEMRKLYKDITALIRKPILFLSVYGKDYHKSYIQKAWDKENVFFLKIDHSGMQWGAWKGFLKRVSEIIDSAG